MDNFLKNYSTPLFVLRSPLLPFKAIFELYAMMDTESGSSYLKDIFRNTPLLRESIYLGSPVLYHECVKYVEKEPSDPKKAERITFSLLKYISRMATRCTPFGLFAGCTLGSYGDRTEIVLDTPENCIRHLKPDMDFLWQVYNFIRSEPTLRHSIKFFPNTSLYTVQQEYRYMEYRYQNGRRSNHLVKIGKSAVLSTILKRASAGITDSGISELIVSFGYAAEEAALYIDELIVAQVLVSELEPNVTGEAYFRKLNRFLSRNAQQFPEKAGAFARAVQIMERINDHPCVERYVELKNEFGKLEKEISENRLFQVDLIKPAIKCQLNKAVLGSLKKGISVLIYFNRFNNAKTKLEQFKRAFSERYENRSVRLTEALDPESGLGYLNTKSDVDSYAGFSNDIDWNARLQKKHEMIVTAAKNGLDEFEITDEFVSSLEELNEDFLLPASFTAVIQVYAQSQNDIIDEANPVIMLKHGGGTSSANFLARFCHADPALEEAVKQLTALEEKLYPGKILAEIAHLPTSRIGNVVARPLLRKFEIPYIASSELPDSHKIGIEDLYLHIENNTLKLTSKILSKEIITRLTCAHNFSSGTDLPLYEFLCDLQAQHINTRMMWDWRVFNNEPFLPRVRYRNIILSRAKWNITINDIKPFIKGDKNIDYKGLSHYFHQTRKVPTVVLIVEEDNELLLDITRENSLKYIVKTITGQKSIVLTESLSNEHNLIVHDSSGGYCHEMAIPFLRQPLQRMEPSPVEVKRHSNPVKINRTFGPGSEWLYIKIYGGNKMLNNLLKKDIPSLARKFVQSKDVIKWFFIRYKDPKPHIRIRFLMPGEGKNGEVLAAIYRRLKPFLSNSSVIKIQIDTYNRELERYGPETMELSESVFFTNSRCACELLKEAGSDENSDDIQLITIMMIDHLLQAASFSEEKRLLFYESGRQNFEAEFNVNTIEPLRKSLVLEYRKLAPVINDLLMKTDGIYPVGHLAKASVILTKYDKELRKLLIAINKITESGKSVSFTQLLESYVHMAINRMTPKYQRLQDLKIYYHLHNHYKSRMVRLKKSIQPSNP